MKIQINSLEYQCWHEVGHAVVCLSFKSGDVESIEFVDDPEAKGIARARCKTNSEIRNFVACGGFATEYVLYKSGRLSFVEDKEFTQKIFMNAEWDRGMFFNRTSNSYEKYTEAEDREFMHFAIDRVAPIVLQFLPEMNEIVKKLVKNKKIVGSTIKHILYRKNIPKY
jgi:hypothetical protein